MLNRIKCFFMGHQRGKRVSEIAANDENGQRSHTHNVVQYVCPRCDHSWTRTVKAKAAA